MDELDQLILRTLQDKGFQKSSVMAPQLGVGERTIRRRIGIMRNKGLVKIIAVLNPVISGHRAWAMIGIKVDPRYLSEVANELVGNPSINFVAYSLGTFDLMIAVYFDIMDDLTKFVNIELTEIKGILNTETMILIWPRKYYNFSWTKESCKYRKNIKDISRNNDSYVYETDDIDREIINILSKNALTPVRVISSTVDVREATTRKRIKNMLQKEVFKIEVVPNPKSIDYEVLATLGLTINHQPAHQIIDLLIQNPAVYLAAVSLGRFNIIISVHFRNIDLLNDFINNDLSGIKGISAIERILHTKTIKYHNTKW